ncbi:uncharacterized protein LOC110176068 [Drosophila serrata]|uniref:uncharacterized protein LOC110176068 n=1 Tax=Drosophila serrata TaxID=7274 RepID=UPI000A1D1449|nr:uncharacterized protein LOC110176068 [Drosophila serrata]
MQNSRVIRRVNAGLSRCLSHHRRLCREIDELDRLLFNDEFLRDPRTLWLHQTSKKEALDVEPASSESEFKGSQTAGIRFRSLNQGNTGSLVATEDCHQGISTPQQQSLVRRPRVRVGFAMSRPLRKMI